VLLLRGDLNLGVALAGVASRVGVVAWLLGLVALGIICSASSSAVARELLTSGVSSAVHTPALSLDLVEALFSVFKMIFSRLSDRILVSHHKVASITKHRRRGISLIGVIALLLEVNLRFIGGSQSSGRVNKMVIGRIGGGLLLDTGAQLVAAACHPDDGSYLLLLLVSQGVVLAHVLIKGICRL